MGARYTTVINPKAKGYRGEMAAVKLCQKLGLKNARRGLSQSAGAIEADIVCDDLKAFWVEVKNRRAGSVIYSYLQQAERDSENTPKIPIVLYKDNNKKLLIIAEAEYLLPILAGHTK